jgi:hypothetical protein
MEDDRGYGRNGEFLCLTTRSPCNKKGSISSAQAVRQVSDQRLRRAGRGGIYEVIQMMTTSWSQGSAAGPADCERRCHAANSLPPAGKPVGS